MTGEITTLFPLVKKEGQPAKGGFGFIRDADGRDRFFHANDLRGAKFSDLREGLKVNFEPIARPNGKGNGLGAELVVVIG